MQVYKYPEMDPGIEQALRRHLTQHAESLRTGEERLGWKVAFNAPPVQEKLGLPHSLLAGMTRSALFDEGSVHSLRGGTRIALEAEIGVALRSDVKAGDDDAAIVAAIESMGPAVEVIDIDRDFAELEAIVAEGVFRRGVVLGEMHPPPEGASLDGIRARVELAGEEVADVDAGVATGHPVKVLRLLAEILEPFGEGLQAGDRIILGSMNVPPPAKAGSTFTLALEGWQTLAVEFEE